MSVQAVKMIDGIRFSIWSPTEVRKYSVVEITAPETYDEDGMPVQGGLMDGRLGTLEPGQKCLTCGNTAARCPGHFGHIELAEPVLHIAFIDNIYKLLQSTCRSCARLKIPQEDLDRFKKIKAKHAAYTMVSQKRIPEQIIEKAKKDKRVPALRQGAVRADIYKADHLRRKDRDRRAQAASDHHQGAVFRRFLTRISPSWRTTP